MNPEPFPLGYSTDGAFFAAAYGYAVNDRGLQLASPVQLPSGELTIRVNIADQTLTFLAAKQADHHQVRDGKDLWVSRLRVSSPQDEQFAALRAATTPRSDKEAERRGRQRRKMPFYIAFSVNDLVFIPGHGLDVGRSGLRLATDVRLPDEDFTIRVLILDRDFTGRAKKAWDRQTGTAEKRRWITGMRFTTISPDDRDFLSDVVDGKASKQKSLKDVLAELQKRPDEADLLLPRNVLDQFLEKLVELRRLAPIKERVTPLVKYHYRGTSTRGDRTVHLLHINSRVVSDRGVREYLTRFAFDEAAKKIEVLG